MWQTFRFRRLSQFLVQQTCPEAAIQDDQDPSFQHKHSRQVTYESPNISFRKRGIADTSYKTLIGNLVRSSESTTSSSRNKHSSCHIPPLQVSNPPQHNLQLRFLPDRLLLRSVLRPLSSQVVGRNQHLLLLHHDQSRRLPHIERTVQHNTPLHPSQTTALKVPILKHNPATLLSLSMTVRTRPHLKFGTLSSLPLKHPHPLDTLRAMTPTMRLKSSNGRAHT